jgi:hypothetical protein
MATQKKTKKRQTKSKRTIGKQVTLARRLASKKRGIPKKKSAKKPTSQKAVVKLKTAVKKTIGGNTVRAPKKQVREKSPSVDTVALPPEGRQSRSGGQAGDLQGLSGVEGAGSESVDELLGEGNAFDTRPRWPTIRPGRGPRSRCRQRADALGASPFGKGCGSRPVSRGHNKTERSTLEAIEVHLRADKNLSAQAAEAIAKMVRVAYGEFASQRRRTRA